MRGLLFSHGGISPSSQCNKAPVQHNRARVGRISPPGLDADAFLQRPATQDLKHVQTAGAAAPGNCSPKGNGVLAVMQLSARRKA